MSTAAEPLRDPAVQCTVSDGVGRITLNRPGRHNSLRPDLVDDLQAALRALETMDLTAVALAAAGPNFSTGGDLAGFQEAARQSQTALRRYADDLVGGLHACIRMLIRLPVPVVCAVQGAATGGAAGLVFASDFVVMADDAYLQPYYVDVGFGPDGGWTALLPELIGARRAFAVQGLNQRIDAREAVALGLATASPPANRLEAQTEELLQSLASKQAGSIRDTRALVWDERRRRRVEARLEAEQRRFVDRICLPETLESMDRFLASMRARRNG